MCALQRKEITVLRKETLVFTDGWYPIDLTYVENSPLVHFAKKTDPVFFEPFLKGEFNDEAERKSILLDDINIEEYHHQTRPLHFIYHTSRCGSTLVTRMLNEIPMLRVLSEPLALNYLFTSPKPINEETIKTRLQKIMTLLDLATPPQYKELVVKWGSWSILSWELIEKSLSPATSLFIWRDPQEVAYSLIKKKPLWLEKNYLESIFERYAPDFKPAKVDAGAESVSLILAAMMHAADCMPAKRLRIDYTMLPTSVLDTICPKNNWVIGGSTARRMTEVSRYNAKSKEKIIFEEDSSTKQSSVPNDIKYYIKKNISNKT